MRPIHQIFLLSHGAGGILKSLMVNKKDTPHKWVYEYLENTTSRIQRGAKKYKMGGNAVKENGRKIKWKLKVTG
jgi:hypothetical protein